MKRRSRRLEKLVFLARAEERRQALAAGRLIRELEEQAARLGELTAYRATYRVESRRGQKVSAVQWKDYQGFLARLDTALRAQERIVRDSERNLEAHRRRWSARRQRVEALERVLENCLRDERQQAERRQQRVDDDRPTPAPPYGES
ncbi:MAG: flagellar export protein FliJ [Woeseiaceae bacterium]|nr:flagellar export protein FliJ [Woeseiaceae bacterium]